MLLLYTTRKPLPPPNDKKGGPESALHVILLHEQIPIRDPRRVANQLRDGQLFWSARRSQQSQACSCGRRLPLRAFTSLSAQTRFSHESGPPRDRGRIWSSEPSSGRSNL